MRGITRIPGDGGRRTLAVRLLAVVAQPADAAVARAGPGGERAGGRSLPPCGQARRESALRRSAGSSGTRDRVAADEGWLRRRAVDRGAGRTRSCACGGRENAAVHPGNESRRGGESHRTSAVHRGSAQPDAAGAVAAVDRARARRRPDRGSRSGAGRLIASNSIAGVNRTRRRNPLGLRGHAVNPSLVGSHAPSMARDGPRSPKGFLHLALSELRVRSVPFVRGWFNGCDAPKRALMGARPPVACQAARVHWREQLALAGRAASRGGFGVRFPVRGPSRAMDGAGEPLQGCIHGVSADPRDLGGRSAPNQYQRNQLTRTSNRSRLLDRVALLDPGGHVALEMRQPRVAVRCQHVRSDPRTPPGLAVQHHVLVPRHIREPGCELVVRNVDRAGHMAFRVFLWRAHVEHEQVIWMPGLVFEQCLLAHRGNRHCSGSRRGGRRCRNRFASCRDRREGN